MELDDDEDLVDLVFPLFFLQDNDSNNEITLSIVWIMATKLLEVALPADQYLQVKFA